jgi:hypothetical protein
MQSSIDLAGKHASYRDWRGADACKADPMAHWADLEAMNALLTEFLAQTKQGPDEPWTLEQIATYEAAATALGPALDGLDSQTSAVGKCKFPRSSGVDEDSRTADDLSQQARRRLADAPTLLPKLKEKAELYKWKAAQLDAQQTGKDSWCGGTPKPGSVPDVYYASTDETGKTEWLFCDDTRVVAPEGAKPEVQLEDPKKKKPNARAYVDAALKYPPSEVQRAPKPGEKAAEQKSAEKKDNPQG